MKFCQSLVLALAIACVPTQAFLGAKLQLLNGLTGSLGGGNGFGGSNGLGLGNIFGNKFGSSGGYSYSAPSRPYYTGSSGGYGYGGGYGYDRSASYNTNSGGERVVKIIKVVVPQENTYSNANYATGYSSGWYPVPQQQPAQVSAPATVAVAPVPISYAQPAPVQPVVSVARAANGYNSGYSTSWASVPQPAPVQIAQPVPVAYPQPVSVSVPEPVQVVQPQPVAVGRTVVEPQTPVKTVRLIVSETDINQGGLSQTYGPPPPANNGWGQNSVSWGNNAGSNLWNKSWKSGGIWEKLGC